MISGTEGNYDLILRTACKFDRLYPRICDNAVGVICQRQHIRIYDDFESGHIRFELANV